MKKIAVLARHPQRQYEALRSSLGCLLEDHEVTYLVLDYEVELDEAFSDNLGFLDEMGGRRVSNHPANVARHGFEPMSLEEMGEFLRGIEVIIPF
jgi:hypothetical protein